MSAGNSRWNRLLNVQGSQSHVLNKFPAPQKLCAMYCVHLVPFFPNMFALGEGKGTRIRFREKEREPNEELNGQ